MDRRIFRTRTMIFQAFLVILQKKPYHEISIVDIAEQADINRSTFYAHFIDKEDLLQKMIADKLDLLAERIRIGVEPSHSTPSFNDPDLIFLALFEHVFEHDYFYQVMLPKDAAGDFRNQFNGLIREAFFARLSKLGIEQKLQVPLDILLDYISCSTIGIMEKWLTDSKIYSPHHMALQLTRLGFLGIYKSTGM
ncbi:TetR/AcrR family transcriptional regulator [Paenibacillus rigui]|nr:TetR/AcrR family transcriptional regulator [Paenibacillus rigui]